MTVKFHETFHKVSSSGCFIKCFSQMAAQEKIKMNPLRSLTLESFNQTSAVIFTSLWIFTSLRLVSGFR